MGECGAFKASSLSNSKAGCARHAERGLLFWARPPNRPTAYLALAGAIANEPGPQRPICRAQTQPSLAKTNWFRHRGRAARMASELGGRQDVQIEFEPR